METDREKSLYSEIVLLPPVAKRQVTEEALDCYAAETEEDAVSTIRRLRQRLPLASEKTLALMIE